jgi:hypothetical protein
VRGSSELVEAGNVNSVPRHSAVISCCKRSHEAHGATAGQGPRTLALTLALAAGVVHFSAQKDLTSQDETLAGRFLHFTDHVRKTYCVQSLAAVIHISKHLLYKFTNSLQG